LQRVFLAEAIVGNPEMLLLDEPLSNLDIRRSRELVEVVHHLVQSRHVTTLLVAHDINPLIECLDKVVYIANGHVATGPPESVLTSSSLSELYGVPVEVLHDSRGNIVILRRSAFATHALGHVGFSGAAGAVLVGVNPVYGLLLFTMGGGSGMA